MSDKGIMDMGDSHNAALSKSWAQPGSGSIVQTVVHCTVWLLSTSSGADRDPGQKTGLSRTATEPESGGAGGAAAAPGLSTRGCR